MAIAMLWGWDGAGMLGFLYKRGVRTERSSLSSLRGRPEPPPRQVINLAGALIHSLHPLPTSPRPFNSESTQNPESTHPSRQVINLAGAFHSPHPLAPKPFYHNPLGR